MYLDLLCKLGKSLSRAQDFALVQESITTIASGSVELSLLLVCNQFQNSNFYQKCHTFSQPILQLSLIHI